VVSIINGVIYARYSSDNQREESIEGQLRECQEYADKQGITIFGTYVDRAYSAKTDNRPEFQRMIKDSGKHLFDVVIVWKLDRFARNRYDSAHYKNTLRKSGVKVISAKENISDGPEGIILESMLEGMSEYYSAELSVKVKRGMTENALKCRYNGGGMLIGYTADSDKQYQLDPVYAPIVKEIFERYADGESISEIVDSLNKREIKTPRGEVFNKSSFHGMLKNRRYIGEYHYADVIVPDMLLAIISIELFEKVQERLEKNMRAPARTKAKEEYLLTTKLFCGKCGSFMVGESGTSMTGKMHYYYKCTHAKQKKGCSKKSVRKEWIEDLVITQTMKTALADSAINRMAEAVVELQSKENTVLPLLHKQLKDTRKSIDNMLNAIQKGVLTSSTKQRLEELETVKQSIEISIAQEEMKKPTLTKEQVVFWISRFKEGDVKDPVFRHRLIDCFVNSIYLYDDRIVLTYNYKDGTKSISLEEVESSDLEECASPRIRTLI
jgi:site-specific DNA recombinase